MLSQIGTGVVEQRANNVFDILLFCDQVSILSDPDVAAEFPNGLPGSVFSFMEGLEFPCRRDFGSFAVGLLKIPQFNSFENTILKQAETNSTT